MTRRTAKGKRAPRGKIQPERVAEVATVADLLGAEKTAEQFGMAVRTVQKYRALANNAEGAPACAAAYAEKRKLAKERMGEEFIRYLRRWSSKLDELVQQAPLERMRDVAGAIKILGDLFTVREVFGGQQPEPDREGPETPEAQGSASDRAAEPVH